MGDKEIILGLSISMISFLSKVLWIKEFDMFFYVFIFMLCVISLLTIWKYERGKPGRVIFFIFLTVTLCLSLYNKNNKNIYVNIVKQKENIGKIYLYEMDLDLDGNFKHYTIYKRMLFLPFFITESKGKFLFFGKYEKIIQEKNRIKIIGKTDEKKEKIVLLDLKTGRIISEEK